MELTQQSAFADLQGYLGLTATELPDAKATAILLAGFEEMFVLFERAGYFYDESDTKKVAMQKNGEIAYGAYLYFTEFAPKEIILDIHTHGLPLEHDVRFGGTTIGEKGGSKTVVSNFYKSEGRKNRQKAYKLFHGLLRGETIARYESSYL